MRGLISINFAADGMNMLNKHPVVMYYSGNNEDLLADILNEEEIRDFIYRNCATLKHYSKSAIYCVTYFSKDDSIDADEEVGKHGWKVSSIYNLLDHADIKMKILAEALANMSNSEENGVKVIISEMLSNGISGPTIINYVRHQMTTNGFSKEDVAEMIKTTQSIIQEI